MSKNKKLAAFVMCFAVCMFSFSNAYACTFISLKASNGSTVVGRTLEWYEYDLDPSLLMIASGEKIQSPKTPDNKNGLSWTTKYNIIGINFCGEPLLGDAINTEGLSVSLLYLPGFAEYQKYDPAKASKTISPSYVPLWIASQFKTVEEVKVAIKTIRVCSILEPILGIAAPVHFIVNDKSGKHIVIEYTKGKLHVFDAPLGVMTNSPSYDWHLTNLCNYVNIRAVNWPEIKLDSINLGPVGTGSGMLGIPGDFTPPSRFIRAVAFSQTARKTTGGEDTVHEIFRILDNFNVPILFVSSKDIPKGGKRVKYSGTQYTSCVDLDNCILYYHTQYNRTVRKILLKNIDFSKLKGIQSVPLDKNKDNTYLDVTPRF